MKCSADISPWSSATCSLGSSSVSPSVVLTYTALWVHSEANIYSTLELRVSTVQHIHAIETLHLYHHPICCSSSNTFAEGGLVRCEDFSVLLINVICSDHCNLWQYSTTSRPSSQAILVYPII